MPVTFQATEAHARHDAVPARAVWPAMIRGGRGLCPACGDGKLWAGYLKAVPACTCCATPLDGAHRADDLPAYAVMMIVGHILVPAALMLEKGFHPPLWIHMVAWIPLSIALSLALLPVVKGAVIGLQWARRMHGFGDSPERMDA